MSDYGETIEVDLEIVAFGKAAVLLSDGDNQEWVAYKLIEDDEETVKASNIGDCLVLDVPLWLAERAGFV